MDLNLAFGLDSNEILQIPVVFTIHVHFCGDSV